MRGVCRWRLSRVLLWLLPLSLPVVLPLLLLTAGWHSYHRLSDEALIAELTFEPLGEQRFEATLSTGDLCHHDRYLILGDQWRLDAHFLKWKYWANLIGLDARYRLERIEGRYADADQQNREATLAHALKPDHLIELTELADALGDYNFLLDARYGSSTYQRIDPAVRYQVYRTQSGIITRTRPREGVVYENGAVTIEIKRPCGDRARPWVRGANWVDHQLNRLFYD